MRISLFQISLKINCMGDFFMSNEEKIQEIVATMRMEGFQLDDDDLAMLKDIQNGKLSYDEARDKILSELYRDR